MGGGNDSVAAGGGGASNVCGLEAKQLLCCWHICRQNLSRSVGDNKGGIREPTGRHRFFCATQRVHLADCGFTNSHSTLGSFSKRFAQRKHRIRWRVGRGAAESRRESEEEEKEGERGDEGPGEEGGGGGGGEGGDGGALAADLRGWRLERAILMAARRI